MALYLISYPDAEINSNSNTVSKWVSCNHPVIYEVQRKDAIFTSIQANSSTQATINSTGVGTNYSATVTAPFQIYVTGSNFPDGEYTALSISTNAIVIDITGMGYSGATPAFTGGYTNIVRENYFIKTNIEINSIEVASSVNKQQTILANISINVGEFLKAGLSYSETFDFDVINEADTTKGRDFSPFFRECWTGYEGDQQGLIPAQEYFMNQVQQLGATYNGNVGDYVLFDTYDTLDPRAKFLCDFEKPTYFEGYPFSLDFIFDIDLDVVDYDIRRQEERYNKSGTSVSTLTTSLDLTQVGFVNRLMIAGSYASTVNTVNVWIDNISLI